MKKRRSENTSINDGDWTTAALSNDFIVADFLQQIKHSVPPPRTAGKKTLFPASFAALSWGLRRPRSRPVLRNDAVTSEKNGEFTRFSPTTPLSWSGGGSGGNSSPSDTVERRFREVKHSTRAGSNKVFPTNKDATSISTRKRKAVAILKEEESRILHERRRLNKELETLQATINDEMARNQYLKKLKVEWDQSYHTSKTTSRPYEHKHAYSNYSFQIGAAPSFTKAPSFLSAYVPSRQVTQTDLFRVDKRAATKERCFMLPDLNAVPFPNDPSCSETLYGLSREEKLYT